MSTPLERARHELDAYPNMSPCAVKRADLILLLNVVDATKEVVLPAGGGVISTRDIERLREAYVALESSVGEQT